MSDKTDAHLAPLDALYAKCLSQVQMIAALDPAAGPAGWDEYTCTCAHEFAWELATLVTPDGEDPLQAQAEIMRGYRRPPAGEAPGEDGYQGPLDTPSGLITYGLSSFANVLRHIEQRRGPA
ncbi:MULTISPECIES: hypothetical protein [Streptomyces]|uniref:Uncharacterized protein n=2 Tax=Streptomyces TaxID=1883 RepID=A0ABU4KDV6_9ACTN|nr:hypothetical protein [Streptomyces roseolus]MDX2295887.1 hypothetical protein [Streptomyces roseolus]